MCLGRHSQLRYCGLFCIEDLPRMHWRDIHIYVYIYDLQMLCIKLQCIDKMQTNHKEVHKHVISNI